MNSRQRVEAALNHQQPDHVPLDLGASAGHRACTSAACTSSARPWSSTRRARRSRSSSPTRCSARSPPTCRTPWASTWSAWAARTRCSASRTRTGSRGPPSTARRCWCPAASTPSPSRTATSSCIPRATSRCRPAAGCPRAGSTSTSIVRQEPIDDDKLNVEDNLEEFGPISDADAATLRRRGRPAAAARAIGRSWPTSAARPSATSPWCPAPWLKHPKGIRDVAEWYMSTVSPLRLRLRGLPAASATSPWRTWRRSTTPWATASRWCSSRAPTSARRAGRSSAPPPTASSTSRSTAA